MENKCFEEKPMTPKEEAFFKEILPNGLKISFFGHREMFKGWEKASEIVYAIVRTALRREGTVSFFVGQQGDFDRMVTEIIREARKELPDGKGNSMLALMRLGGIGGMSEEERSKYDIVLGEFNARHKGAIEEARNKRMVDMSDLVVAYVKRKGGAYKAMKYAEKQGKRVFNIATLFDT